MSTSPAAEELRERLLRLADAMRGSRVLLVGDMVADHYIQGRTSRISREAPVLILKYQDQYVVPGQAANTASNVASLGGKVTIVGAIGRDSSGRALTASLRKRGVSTAGLIQRNGYATMTKTRILAGGHHTCRQQVIRIDDDDRMPPDAAIEKQVLANMKRFGDCDAIVVSDYGYGLVSETVWAKAREIAARRGIPIILDSRYHLLSFTGATLVTPNEGEALECAGMTTEDDYEIGLVGSTLLRKTRAANVLITRGNEGMVLFRAKKKPHAIGIFGSDEVTDVTGAGDTVVAANALALASGATPEDAAEIANVAAGIVVMKLGTATVSADELVHGITTGEPPPVASRAG